jgi:ABC-type polysaccharide/polyol phosphate export permease
MNLNSKDDKNQAKNFINELDVNDPQKSAELFEKGMYRPRNLIVVIGQWVLMGATAIISIIVLCIMIYNVVDDPGNFLTTLPLFVLFLFLLFLSVAVLFKTTKRYKEKD